MPEYLYFLNFESSMQQILVGIKPFFGGGGIIKCHLGLTKIIPQYHTVYRVRVMGCSTGAILIALGVYREYKQCLLC